MRNSIIISIALTFISCSIMTNNEKYAINPNEIASYQISDEERFSQLTKSKEAKNQICVMAVPTNRSNEMLRKDHSKWERAGMYCSYDYAEATLKAHSICREGCSKCIQPKLNIEHQASCITSKINANGYETDLTEVNRANAFDEKVNALKKEKETISAYKKLKMNLRNIECNELGFKTGSELHQKCILELYKRELNDNENNKSTTCYLNNVLNSVTCY